MMTNIRLKKMSSILLSFALGALFVFECAGQDAVQGDISAPSAPDAAPSVTPEAHAVPVPSLKTFEERRRWIINQAVADPAAAIGDHPFFVAEACFIAGRNDEGREVARKGYLSWSAHDPNKVRATDFFRLWPAMDCYARYKQYLDQESKDAFKKFMTAIRCYSYGYTANLSMLMWTTRLLGGQEWGDDAFVPAARDTTSHYKADPDIPMKTRLMRMIDAQAITGGEEYASRPYGAGNLAPILCIAQLANDPELKNHARIAHETALARYAPVWLDGALIITSRRSYPDIFNDPMGVATWFWVFFGGKMTPVIHSHALEAAVLGEPAPAVIEHAATDRARAFTVLNRFQEGSSGRQISWIDRTYGVFSESFHTNPRPFGQTYPFGVRWIVPNSPEFSIFWFSVPSQDAENTGSHPHGFDVSAQTTLQHQGTLLYVVNTEGGRHARFPYGLSYVPGGALAMVDESSSDGRVFLHYPGVLIAFSATKPFKWDRKAPIKSPSGKPKSGDSEFRVPGPTFAAAIETAPEDEFDGGTPEARLKRFRDIIVNKSRLQLIPGETLAGTYTDRKGNILHRVAGGSGEVNGKGVDFEHWPWAESPWVNQPSKTAPLTVTDGTAMRTYDLKNWTITEKN
jgi:hypothetical protein